MLPLMLALTLFAGSQEAADDRSRAEELRVARQSKAQNLRPPTPTFLENGLNYSQEDFFGTGGDEDRTKDRRS